MNLVIRTTNLQGELKMKYLLAVLLTVGFIVNAHAAVVTVGDLTTDDTTNFITDTAINRLYTRFDAFDLSYADTLLATQTGGAYDGWSIATASIAVDFITSAFGSAAAVCDPGPRCGDAMGYGYWLDGAFGASSSPYNDIFAFLSDTQGQSESFFISDEPFIFRDPGGSLEFYDTHTIGSGHPINYLLYKDPARVDESSSIYLLAFGLLGLFGVARRKV